MPVIPTFAARTDTGRASRSALVDVGIASSSGMANARLGEQVSQIAGAVYEKERKTREAGELSNVQMAAQRRLSDIDLEFENDQDFTTQRSRYQQRSAEVMKELQGTVSPEVWQRFQPDYQSFSLSRELEVEKRARAGLRDTSLAALSENVANSTKAYATAPNDLDRETTRRSTIQAIAAQVDAGNITRVQSVEMIRKFEQEAALQRLTIRAAQDPEGLAQTIGRSFGEGTAAQGFDANVEDVFKREGGYVANDAGAGETNFGINISANPDVDVKNLTQEQARDIYKTRYWDAIGADNLPPAAQGIAFDAAVNQGVGYARQMLARTGGDPVKMLADREQRYREIAAADPTKAQYLDGWLNRLKEFPAPQGTIDDPELAMLDPQQIWGVLRTARQEQRLERAEADRESAEQMARFNSDFAIALGRGEKSYADIEAAYQAGQITPENRTRYTLALDENTTKATEQANMIRRVDGIGQTQPPLDPKNTDDQKALNLHYQNAAQQWAELPFEQQLSNTVTYAAQYGMVPDAAQSFIRGGLRSGGNEQRIQTAQMVRQLQQANPYALKDFADEDIALATNISNYTAQGIAPAEAVTRAIEAERMPPAQREQLREAFGYDRKAQAADAMQYLQPKFEQYFRRTDPTVKAAMAAELDAITRDEYTRNGGNFTSARDTAFSIMQKTWGETRVNGEIEVMKYAPDLYYGLPGEDATTTAAWIKESLAADLTKAGIAADASTIKLTPYMTMAGPDGRIEPHYAVYQNDNNGIPQILLDERDGSVMTFKPNYYESPRAERQRLEMRANIEAAALKRSGVPQQYENTRFERTR